MAEPTTKCGACGIGDDHPKNQVVVGFSNPSTDGEMFHKHDFAREGCIYYHFDCPTEWHDLYSKLATVPVPAEDPKKPWEEWTEASAAVNRATADRNAATIAKAKSGVHGDDLRAWIQEVHAVMKPAADPSGATMMAGGMDQTLATAVLAALAINSSTATIGTKTITGPLHMRLMTANGTDSSNGTELGTSGGYTAGGQAISFGSASSASVSSNGANSWTSMPSTTLTGMEEWDTSGSPQRTFWAPWSAGSIVVGSGNTFTVASGSLTNTLS